MTQPPMLLLSSPHLVAIFLPSVCDDEPKLSVHKVCV